MRLRIRHLIWITTMVSQTLFFGSAFAEGYPFLFGKDALAAFNALQSRAIPVIRTQTESITFDEKTLATPQNLFDKDEQKKLLEIVIKAEKKSDLTAREKEDNPFVVQITQQVIDTEVHRCKKIGYLYSKISYPGLREGQPVIPSQDRSLELEYGKKYDVVKTYTLIFTTKDPFLGFIVDRHSGFFEICVCELKVT